MNEQRKPHPYADVIKAWASGRDIQFRHTVDGKEGPWTDWVDSYDDSTPNFAPEMEWRVKPRMARINGIEFPAPETEAPEDNPTYFRPTPESFGDLAVKIVWVDDSIDRTYLARGRVHLTREAAIAHARAEILAVGGEV